MKCFMPVYALALALAVTSDMVQQVSAANCGATVCGTPDACATVTDGAGTLAKVVAKPTLTCASQKFAYIKSLKIVPDTAADVSKIALYVTKDGSAAPTAVPNLAATAETGAACTNTYLNVGLTDATADVQAVVGCVASTTDCKFKYIAEWACQPPPSCAATCTTDCTTGASSNTTSIPLTKPTTGWTACGDGLFAYMTALEVGVTGTATTADEVLVSFTNGATTTALAATKDTATCDGKWTNVGMTTATADVVGKIMCLDATTPCDVKYKATWACQTTKVTPAPTSATPGPTTPAPTNATSTPTPTPTSGVAGANPAVVWGTALVAAVAGANFAAPL